ncbi:hypothetical protein CDAR_164271 [Caerostris darwini]|uniref:EGF-like domain-containing protein n=1 Tax=Caerostris darwini TaxID=1538125 RepID=A0AAV4X888_9ARAC|nr:hypothetical protein CDAR_164271 [Caerostris darwini]
MKNKDYGRANGLTLTDFVLVLNRQEVQWSRIGFILLLFAQYVKPQSEKIEELLDTAIACNPKARLRQDPVIAISQKTLIHSKTMEKRKLRGHNCVTQGGGSEKCIFGSCKNNACLCNKGFEGPSCTNPTVNCWLFYCKQTECPRLYVYKVLRCECSSKYFGVKVRFGRYIYDEGYSDIYKPPPPGYLDSQGGVGSRYGGKSAGSQGNARAGQRYGQPGQQGQQGQYGQGHMGPQSAGGSGFKGNSGSIDNDEDSTEDIDEALEELEEENVSSVLRAGRGYLIVILNILIYNHL